jgi:hypothetical protein
MIFVLTFILVSCRIFTSVLNTNNSVQGLQIMFKGFHPLGGRAAGLVLLFLGAAH